VEFNGRSLAHRHVSVQDVRHTYDAADNVVRLQDLAGRPSTSTTPTDAISTRSSAIVEVSEEA
jgi:YD repeat-containing protein